ncbi:MAG: ASKHA domain-containing protein [Oscillospiraceae bacterium]|nr:ASKHA domain-containing protein [Oscillospiraceae bacterium]
MDFTFTVLTDATERLVSAGRGDTLLDALRRADIFVEAPCGGHGVCGKCRVTLEDAQGAREVLACQTPAAPGLRVRTGGEAAMHIEEFGRAGAVQADGEQGLGVAVDIGTTTVVVHLFELSTGRRLGTKSGANDQRPYGADVISRISYAAENGTEALREAIAGQLAGYIRALCAAAGADDADVRRIVIAGNTVMEHLFAGLDPTPIGVAPFRPATLFRESEGTDRRFGAFPGARLLLCPCVAGYVGGDITAGLLACGAQREEKPCLFLDVGTNGEMALCRGGRFDCCATAAGPAFEGAEITCGMAGVTGAINAVRFEDGALRCSVIGGGDAKGVCGSGLIDAVAVMLRLGVVDETGRLCADAAATPLLGENENGTVFFLTEDRGVFITQNDIRQVQLAKAAVAAGLRILIDRAGLRFADIDKLFLAGGFGSYIDKTSAVEIGLLPRELLGRIEVVGNSAGDGACASLLRADARRTLAGIADSCTYVELSSCAAFMDAYVDEMSFEP